MNCSEFWRQYAEHGISSELEEHLKTCPVCADEFLIDRAIDAAVAAPANYSPPDAVWDRIASALDAAPSPEASKETFTEKIPRLFGKLSSIRFYIRPAYAWACALVIVSVLTTYIATRQFAPWQHEDPLTAVRELEQSEGRYLAAIETLSKQIEGKKSEIQPELYDLYVEKLAVLDEYIVQCRKAVDENNENINARLYLALAYKEKAETLKEIASLL